MPLDLVGEGIEFLGYFVGFWAFLLSPKFRASTLARWHDRSGFEHFFTAIDIFVSTACGLAPVALVYWLVS
jgi:hypothetical protein